MEIVYEDKDLLLVDNFLDLPDKVRNQGLKAKYGDFVGPQDGQVYKRVSVQTVPAVVDALNKAMGRPIQLLGMSFRLNYEDELPNNEIHADLGWGTYALVLYLSEPPSGQISGTAFWKHKKAQTDRIKAGQLDVYKAVKDDWNNVDAWEQETFVSGKYNSAVIYRSELFHSLWPFAAYGTKPEDGRLAVVAFFS